VFKIDHSFGVVVKNQTIKQFGAIFLVMLIVPLAYWAGTLRTKKIHVVVTQNTNTTQGWSDKVKSTIVFPYPNDYDALDLKLYPNDTYIWIEVDEAAFSFNEDYSDIRFYRKENDSFVYVYHEKRSKDINRKTKRFTPLLENSPTSPMLKISSLDEQNIISYSIHHGNKIVHYMDNNIDGIWDTMTIKENDTIDLYKYDFNEKKWVPFP
jgi:hypothetical protein